MQPKDQSIDVWGKFACFTNPVMKVERFSYPVITPSAARGIYDAIYCKPKEFRWQLTKVEIFNPPRYIALRRNEVKDKTPSYKTISAWMEGKQNPEPIWADGDRSLLGTDMKGRTQRQTMALKDVKYRLHAEIRPWPQFKNRQQALESQFRRRAENGKCVYQPYFGCREFPVYFDLVLVDTPAVQPITTYSGDLGWMLYDVFDLSRPGTSEEQPSISLFNARVRNGVLDVPPYESDAVKKATGRER